MPDLRYALRQLLKSPSFTFIAVLSLALGIGANTAVFSLVNAFLLRSLPVPNPEELVLFRHMHGLKGRMVLGYDGYGYTDPVSGRKGSTSFSLLAFERLREPNPFMRSVFAFSPLDSPNILIDGEPEVSSSAQLVSGNYHEGLGVRTIVGRPISEDDDRQSAAPVAVISYRFWERRFGRDPAVLGRTIIVNQVATTIVGVTPQDFEGALQAGESCDITLPLAHHLKYLPGRTDHLSAGYWWVRIMGRLAPGAKAEQAAAALEANFQAAAREGWLSGRPDKASAESEPDAPSLLADPGARGENNVRSKYAGSLHLLQGLAGLVLAAACANVANLLLAAGARRRREIAVRLALGASRARVVRQLLLESLLLASLGTTLGVLLAAWSRHLLAGWSGSVLTSLRPSAGAPLSLSMPFDTRVLAFTILAACGTVLLFGLAPALCSTRVELNAEFQGGAREIGRGPRPLLSHTLIVVQIALSVILLVCTGLFTRTLQKLQDVDSGFNRRSLVLFCVDSGSAGYKRAQLAELYTRIQSRLESVPGVKKVSYSGYPLLSQSSQGNSISIPGRAAPANAPGSVRMNNVAPNFFATTELPLLLGRSFTERDDASAPRVGIINRALAELYFGSENPIGRQLEILTGPRGTVEIVGVAKDAKYVDLRSPISPTLYLPTLQRPGSPLHFVLRVSENASAQLAAVRAAVREIDPRLPVLNLRTLDEQIDRLNATELLFARLSGAFGLLSLTLACIGLYGLLSFQVLRRTSEIGLRMALGALPSHIQSLIVREALGLVGLGIAAGLTLALIASRLLATMLFETSAADPSTYALVAVALGAVGLSAALLPARRAARVDPIEALRAE